MALASKYGRRELQKECSVESVATGLRRYASSVRSARHLPCSISIAAGAVASRLPMCA